MPVEIKTPTATALVGRRLISIDRYDFSWPFGFSGDFSITAESSWRIVIDGSVRLGDVDHGQRFGLPAPVDAVASAEKLLMGRLVEAEIPGMVRADLTLRFEDGAMLQLLAQSSGYEAWQLNGPGLCVVGRGSD